MTMLCARAFTLVEVLIVVVILGVLAAIVVPNVTNATTEAEQKSTITELQKLRRHIEVYQARNSDRLPDVEEGEGTWGQLVGAEYLSAPPVNTWVGFATGRIVHFSDAPDTEYHTDYGWVYDPMTGQVWAASHDAEDLPLSRD